MGEIWHGLLNLVYFMTNCDRGILFVNFLAYLITVRI